MKCASNPFHRTLKKGGKVDVVVRTGSPLTLCRQSSSSQLAIWDYVNVPERPGGHVSSDPQEAERLENPKTLRDTPVRQSQQRHESGALPRESYVKQRQTSRVLEGSQQEYKKVVRLLQASQAKHKEVFRLLQESQRRNRQLSLRFVEITGEREEVPRTVEKRPSKKKSAVKKEPVSRPAEKETSIPEGSRHPQISIAMGAGAAMGKWRGLRRLVQQLSVPMSKQPNAPLAITALVTPPYRDLLGDQSRMVDEILRHITRIEPHLQGRTVTATLGVIDRIGIQEVSHVKTFGHLQIKNKDSDQETVLREATDQDPSEIETPLNGGDGIAISISHEAVPSPLATQTSGSTVFQTPPGHITFAALVPARSHVARDSRKIHGVRDPSLTYSATIALAATKMETGSDFILQRQKWTCPSDSGAAPKMLENTSIDRAVIIEAQEDAPEGPFWWMWPSLRSLPLYHHPITPPRRIASSFGNVIQSFEGTDSTGRATVMPASQELEQVMPHERLALKNSSSSGIEVWAAVRTSGTPETRLARLAMPTETLNDLAQRGFKLYRVQGGGGGWEGKGGPITLDVEDSANEQQNDSQESAFDELAIERYLSGASSEFKSGDTVQFYLVGLPRSYSSWMDERENKPLLDHDPMFELSAFSIGTLPTEADRGTAPGSSDTARASNWMSASPSFDVLSKRATFSVEAHALEIDHGSSKIGRLYHTNLPPMAALVMGKSGRRWRA